MAFKAAHIPGVGDLKLYKRRGVRQIRLAVTNTGEVRVTMPTWAPYRLGLEFAISKSDWIERQKPQPVLLIEGQRIGKAHTLHFEPKDTAHIRTRIRSGQIIITIPHDVTPNEPAAQAAASKAALRALKSEAVRLLPIRIKELSAKHDIPYRSVSIKQLKGRWGSCNQHKDIVLNSFLMQLPWNLIDYVIMHELTHTKVMAHGQPFWTELGRYVDNLTHIRKMMKQYQPALKSSSAYV